MGRVSWSVSASALAWGALGGSALAAGPAAAQAVEPQGTPAAPTADPSTTRSEEPAPDSGSGRRDEPPATDTAGQPGQTPTAPQAPGASGANDGRLTYDAAFFRTFSPANALEIIQRTPGFTLDAGDAEVRGFGQAAGNVVINGQRPSSKTDTLQTVLQRIPANRVLRVEVGRGDLFGAEFAGRPQVANLVLTAGGGLAGTVAGTWARDFTGKIFPGGTASALLRSGRSSFNASVGVENDETTDQGYDRLIALPSGRLLEFRDKVNLVRGPTGFITAGWESKAADDDIIHLNGRLSLDRFSLTQSNLITFGDGTQRDDQLFQRYRTRGFEVGGDYTKPLAGGGIKLIGVLNRRFRRNVDTSFFGVTQGVVGGFAQDLDDQRDETVVRIVWNRQDLRGWTVETGVEGALNRLVSRVDLFEVAAGGGRSRIDLPVDDATVQEYRGEAFVNVGRPLSKRLRLDLGVTFEASELTVSGDAQAERVLKFIKPRATLDWRAPTGWHAQASIKRTVAQLNFEDFISSAELANEQRVNGGNAQLLPQRAWEALAFLEKPILGDGLVRIEAGYNRISLVQDRVPTPEGFDAPGNLGDGRLFLARSRVDAPLGSLGIKGGRITLYGSYVNTSVTDPYTGEDRPFSGNSDYFFEVQFRQDLKKFAWGVTIDGSTPSVFYRRNEEDEFFRTIAYTQAFVEYRPDARTQISFNVDNATNGPSFRRRTFYAPDRRSREPSAFEFRHRNKHVVPYIVFKRSFG